MKPRKSVCRNPRFCWLCGLPIPAEIVSGNHPLYGTVDHVVPLSRGGQNSPDNRFPAHRYCNNRRGNRGLDLQDRYQLQVALSVYFQRIGVDITKSMLTAARQRAGMMPAKKPVKPPVKQGVPGSRKRTIARQLAVWEDDGGAVYQEAR